MLLPDRFLVSDQSLAWFQSILPIAPRPKLLHPLKTAPVLLTSGISQVSGLGPTTFLTYTEGTTDIFSVYSLQYHLYT